MIAVSQAPYPKSNPFSPGCGYYPKLSKSVLIVYPNNLEDRTLLGLCHGFKVFTGARYLGIFIGDDESKRDCLQCITMKREKKISMIRKMSVK